MPHRRHRPLNQHEREQVVKRWAIAILTPLGGWEAYVFVKAMTEGM